MLMDLEDLEETSDGCAALLCRAMRALLFVIRLRCRVRHLQYQVQLLHEGATACSPLKRERELAAELEPYCSPPRPPSAPHPAKRRIERYAVDGSLLR